MRKLVCVTLFVAVAATSALAAPTAKISLTEGGLVQGPFRATLSNGDVRSFLTFCVEPEDEVIPNTEFNYTVDEAIYYREAGDDDVEALQDDTKKVYAAYLNAGSPLLPEWGDTNWLQALYAAQGLVGDIDPDPLADDRVLAEYDTRGWQAVRVLNLWEGESYVKGNDIQSVLIRVPAPGAVLLSSVGLGFFGWLRRRRSI